MFTDMVGYTALMQENEPKARALRDHLRDVVRRFVDQHGGRILQFYGDGVLSSFRSAIESTRCAIEIQEALRGEPKVPVRIGIHVGDVVFEEEGIYGDSVNVASRIESLAAAGGIFISDRVNDEIRNQPELEAKSLGLVELKNVLRPIEIFALTGEGLTVPEASELLKKESPEEVLSLEKDRIAVLPFANISPDSKDEYFADGMTEELISNLSRIGGLRVIARTSVMQYKGVGKSVAEIGRELKVGTVLEGSVRKAAGKLRIVVQLIDARSEEHLWSVGYDRDFKDVFAIQSEIAQRVAEALKVKLMAREKKQIEKEATENLEAYDLYLRGWSFLNERTEKRFNKGIRYFEQAIAKDPTYAPAYAGLAEAHGLLGLFGALPPKDVMPKAKAAAEKALEIDDALSEAHTSLGFVRSVYDWAWSDAEREFERARELKPSNSTAHRWYAVTYLTPMGRLDEAIEEMKRSLELDPLCLSTNEWLGTEYLLARRYEKAIELYRKTLQMDPNYPPAHFYLSQAYMQKAKYKEAVTEVQKAITLSGRLPRTVATLGRIYAVSGESVKAQKVLEELSELSKRRYVPSYYVALIYEGLGQKDRAFEWLEKALEERDSELVFLKVDPSLDILRSDSRFFALLKKTNLESQKET